MNSTSTTSTAVLDTLRAEREQITPRIERLADEIATREIEHKKLSRKATFLDKTIDELAALDDPNWQPKARVVNENPNRPKRSTTDKYDWPAIAARIASAKADGTYSVEEMMAEFKVGRSVAYSFLTRCRERGLLTADNKLTAAAGVSQDPPQSVEKVDGKLLRCKTCPSTFSVSDAAGLNSHTMRRHGRSATSAERQPVAA